MTNTTKCPSGTPKCLGEESTADTFSRSEQCLKQPSGYPAKLQKLHLKHETGGCASCEDQLPRILRTKWSEQYYQLIIAAMN